jgi:hypothetical protein
VPQVFLYRLLFKLGEKILRAPKKSALSDSAGVKKPVLSSNLTAREARSHMGARGVRLSSGLDAQFK